MHHLVARPDFCFKNAPTRVANHKLGAPPDGLQQKIVQIMKYQKDVLTVKVVPPYDDFEIVFTDH